jgi:hypothetical protein
MKTILLITLLAIGFPHHLFAELPFINTPEIYFQCNQDADCAVAGDSCRSCGKLIVINKKYLKQFNEFDLNLRKEKNIQPTCESCDTSQVILKCIENKCSQ